MDRLQRRITLSPQYELSFVYDIEAARNSPTDGVSNLDIYWFPEVPKDPSPKLVAAFNRELSRFTELVRHATGEAITIVCDFGKTADEFNRAYDAAFLATVSPQGAA